MGHLFGECPGVLSMIESHYASEDLKEAVLSALRALGSDAAPLRPEDTAPIDEFHIRGREATLELAGKLDLGPQHHVLDVGSGIGGPSRHLAFMYGCRVIGLDLTEQYCQIAGMIAKQMGMSSKLVYLHGNALDMPFPDGSFDVVWTQHAAMNIPDKVSLYAEIRRVLKPGGLFAMYDVLAGGQGAPYFPLPWARDPSMSYLLLPQELHELLEKTGFKILSWRDTSELGLKWFREVAAKRMAQPDGKPRPGLQVLLGADIRAMSKNVALNLEENRIVLMEVIAR
jgi:ubiquinone/menaquinone biosynthesis C-methylase UbiE